MSDRDDETENKKKTIRAGWSICLLRHDGLLPFNTHVRTLRSGKIHRRHNVQQTRQSGFEVSLSYLCPSHLWHYRVSLVQTVMCDRWRNETDVGPKQRIKMAKKKTMTPTFCAEPQTWHWRRNKNKLWPQHGYNVRTKMLICSHGILICGHKINITCTQSTYLYPQDNLGQSADVNSSKLFNTSRIKQLSKYINKILTRT